MMTSVGCTPSDPYAYRLGSSTTQQTAAKKRESRRRPHPYRNTTYSVCPMHPGKIQSRRSCLQHRPPVQQYDRGASVPAIPGNPVMIQAREYKYSDSDKYIHVCIHVAQMCTFGSTHKHIKANKQKKTDAHVTDAHVALAHVTYD